MSLEFEKNLLNHLHQMEEDCRNLRRQIQEHVIKVDFEVQPIIEEVLYCKECSKPFKGFRLGVNKLVNSIHPELSELCDDCLPVGTKADVEKWIDDYKIRCELSVKNIRKK